MKVRVQLVQNNPLHKIPTIFVNIHRTQFMFNVIPTLLRHRKKHKINLYNSSYIFFTKNSIEAMGGLPNLLLFRSGTEHSNVKTTNKIYLFGDSQLIRYFQKLRFKLGYKILRVSYTDWQKNMYRLGVFSPQLFKKLKQNPNLPSIFAKMEHYLPKIAKYKQYFDSRYYVASEKTKFINEDCTYYHTNLLDIYPLINNKGSTSLTSYIIILAEQKKDIDVNIQRFTNETNIRKQKDIKELFQNGKITKDGKTYLKKDYLFKQNYKPSNILILHHEDTNSIVELLNNKVLNNYFQNGNKTGLVVHIVEEIELLQSQQMQKIISKFDKDTKHLWFNHQMHNINIDQQVLLEDNMIYSSIWSGIFPNEVKNIKQQRFKYYSQKIAKKVEQIFPNMTHFLYRRIFNYVKNDYLGDSYQERLEAQPTDNNLTLFKKIINKQFNLPKQQQQNTRTQIDRFQPKVIMLGTSSSMPTIDRNTSGILITLFTNNSILFDCGEQIYEQIINHFSPTQLQHQILKIRVVFVTHIHSDHNLGILNLISQRRKLMKKHSNTQKLFLIIPFNVFNWFQSYNQTIQDLSDSCEVVFTQYLLNESFEQSQAKQSEQFVCSVKNFDYKFETELQSSTKNKSYIQNYLKKNGNYISSFHHYLKETGYNQFTPIRVIHCPQSFGIVVKSNEFKVSYSGDTRPSIQFQKLAEKSNVMIHEATFNDQQAKIAESYLHSTVSQAVSIGLSAKADNLVLTHFNQDFKSPKAMSDLQKNEYYNKNTILAFDHLQLNLSKPHNLCEISKQILRVNTQVQQYLKKIKTKKPFQGNQQQ